MNQTEFKNFEKLLSGISDYYGKSLSPTTIQLYWNALETFNFDVVKRLMNDHVKVSRFMPSISELLDMIRFLDGRPGPEEAWSMVAKVLNDEGATLVWTGEMASAFFVALGCGEDRIAARMAFKEAYISAVFESRRQGRAVKWTVSIGRDPNGREGPLLEAVMLGRLSSEHVSGLLPHKYEWLTNEIRRRLSDKTGVKFLKRGLG